MKTLNVLVTGVGAPLGQSIMKAAQRANLPCRLLATDRHPLSVGFHWADAHYVVPTAAEPSYITQLITICRKERVDAVMIGSEGEIHVLAQEKEAFEKKTGTRIIVSSPEVLRISADKWETVRFLAAHGLDYPRSALPEEPEQLETLVGDLGFPLIVKPRNGAGSKGLFKVHSQQELARVTQLVRHPIVQEYLQPDDQEYTTAAFVDKLGQPQGTIVMRRELAAGLTYRAWVEENPRVAATTQAVVSALGPLGPCNVQLRLTERGPVPFEINARFSSSTAMRAHFGYNEVEMALRCYILGEKIVPPHIRRGIALRFWEELYSPEWVEAETALPSG
jgi:carbamoyl-phosphate synthase large subunit